MRTNSPEHLGHLVLDLFAELELERKLRAMAKDAKNCSQRQLSRMAQISSVAQSLGATGVCMLVFEARELLRAHAVSIDLGQVETASAETPPWDQLAMDPQAALNLSGRKNLAEAADDEQRRQDHVRGVHVHLQDTLRAR